PVLNHKNFPLALEEIKERKSITNVISPESEQLIGGIIGGVAHFAFKFKALEVSLFSVKTIELLVVNLSPIIATAGACTLIISKIWGRVLESNKKELERMKEQQKEYDERCMRIEQMQKEIRNREIRRRFMASIPLLISLMYVYKSEQNMPMKGFLALLILRPETYKEMFPWLTRFFATNRRPDIDGIVT
ncbi:MAG: hypothetical protein JXA94_06890, partial [Parachlamydiales bacterium]|nr:hypothetical protein [Parachlamydiales bacterium]